MDNVTLYQPDYTEGQFSSCIIHLRLCAYHGGCVRQIVSTPFSHLERHTAKRIVNMQTKMVHILVHAFSMWVLLDHPHLFKH